MTIFAQVIEAPTQHGMAPDGIQLDGEWRPADTQVQRPIIYYATYI